MNKEIPISLQQFRIKSQQKPMPNLSGLTKLVSGAARAFQKRFEIPETSDNSGCACRLQCATTKETTETTVRCMLWHSRSCSLRQLCRSPGRQRYSGNTENGGTADSRRWKPPRGTRLKRKADLKRIGNIYLGRTSKLIDMLDFTVALTRLERQLSLEDLFLLFV